MNLPGNGSALARLATFLGRSRPEQDVVDEANARSMPCLSSQPTPLEIEWDEIAVGWYHLDQHTGFESDGTILDIHAISDLVEQICITNNESGLHDAQASWLRLYSAYDATSVSAEVQATQSLSLVDDFLYRARDKSGSSSAMIDSDALFHETAADATEVETVSAKLEVIEIQASSFEDTADAGDTRNPTMETPGTALTTNFESAEPGTGEAGPCDTPTAKAPTPTPTTNEEGVVEIADFDPERDVIGVFYATNIDALTGNPITPKLRVSDNSDGAGHIISLDGCDVARVIGAKNLTEHQVKLIAE